MVTKKSLNMDMDMDKGRTGVAARKPMRLKGYDYSQAGYYYVTICTLNPF
jgi:hypothetical protein